MSFSFSILVSFCIGCIIWKEKCGLLWAQMCNLIYLSKKKSLAWIWPLFLFPASQNVVCTSYCCLVIWESFNFRNAPSPLFRLWSERVWVQIPQLSCKHVYNFIHKKKKVIIWESLCCNMINKWVFLILFLDKSRFLHEQLNKFKVKEQVNSVFPGYLLET